MQKIGEALNLSAGGLVGHLNCRYLTELDLKVANGELKKPKVWDPVLETLVERGALHEQGFIEHIKLGVTVINGVGVDSMSVVATGEAIRNLLDGVVVAAREQAVPIGCIQKISEKEDDLPN